MTLRVLLVEDSIDDAELLVRELRKGGLEPVWERVDGAEEMSLALSDKKWDIVIADYYLPGFGGLAALELLHGKNIDIPFIIVSGKVGEETAVEAMKAGAHDYLLKGQLARLVPAIRRELSEASVRQERKQAEEELRILKKAIDNIPLGVTISNGNGTIIYTNPAEAAMHGYQVEELLGNSVKVLAPPDTWNGLVNNDLSSYFEYRRESINIRKNGERFPVNLISSLVMDDHGESIAVVSACEDITERKRIESTLRKQLAAIESSMDGIAILGDDNCFVYVNRAFARMYGYKIIDELIGQKWQMLLCDDEMVRLTTEVEQTLWQLGRWRGETAGKKRNGSVFTQEVTLTMIEGGGIICVVRDISERKEAEEKLRYMSTHDPLTGFYNRAYFEEEMERLERSRLFPVSIVMADVDGLKTVNDTQGHAAGDKLLQQAAKTLFSVFRAEDMIARIGGDEFAVLLPEADESVVKKALERIRETMERLSGVEGGDGVSLSLGAATANEGGELLEALKLADTRMYKDKLIRRRRLASLKNKG